MLTKLSIIISVFILSFSSYSKTISCSIWNGNSDGAIESPEGHSVNYGVFAGVSDIKIICDEGYNIEAPNLMGFVLGPGFHSQKMLFSCFGSHNLEGEYYGLKGDVTVGLELGAGLMVGKNGLCTFGAAGFGLGANVVLGKFTITKDDSRIINGHLYNNNLAEIKSWSYKKCHFIKGIMASEDLSKNDSYLMSDTQYIENRCPTEAGFYPKKIKPSEMARLMNIDSEERANEYNKAIDNLLMRSEQLGIELY